MIVMVSGGLDPVHVGHIRLITEAAKQGPVIVALNSDEWLLRKKGYLFYPSWTERREVVMAIKGVASVVPVDDADGTVCEALARLRPSAFANGGDRTVGNDAEVGMCNRLGIMLLYNVGGPKVQDSQELVKNARRIG